jgi:hypothetical protein
MLIVVDEMAYVSNFLPGMTVMTLMTVIKAPLAHLVGGAGRPEAWPTAILQDTHSLEGVLLKVAASWVRVGW